MKDLIMDMFNVDSNDIDKFETLNDENGSIEIIIRLKRKECYCPCCGNKLIGNGISRKDINHKVLSDRNSKLIYEANRYRCRVCGYSKYEKNPFSLKGFSQSILTMNQLMIDLHDPRYNYTMLSQKYNISVSEVILYLDSFVTIPKIALPVNLGIDEIHDMLNNWKAEIVNSFAKVNGTRVSNGPIEGRNSLIKKILKIANGYTNFKRFRNRIIYCLNTLAKHNFKTQ